MGTAKYDPEATLDPECKACMVGWPIHVDRDTGKRYHVEVVEGVVTICPTKEWFDFDQEGEIDKDGSDK